MMRVKNQLYLLKKYLETISHQFRALIIQLCPVCSSQLSSQVSEDCNFNKDWLKILHITKEEEDNDCRLMVGIFRGNWLVNNKS